jgi:cell division protein ZipA
MARAARAVARTFDADLKDEQHSVMTAQTLEHCRQRIRDFRRRQMSRPA